MSKTFVYSRQLWGPLGGMNHPIYAQDAEVWLGPAGTSSTGKAVSANTLYAVRVYNEDDNLLFNKLRSAITVAHTAGSFMRMAICNAAANRRPGTIVVEGASLAADVTGFREYDISATLSRGHYWLLYGSSGSGTMAGGTLSETDLGVYWNASSPTNHNKIQFLQRSWTFGTIGDQTGQTWTITANSTIPRIAIRPDLSVLP